MPSRRESRPDAKKTVVVCGDLVWDTHIARLPSAPRGYFQPHLHSQLECRAGGAWYLRHLIKQVLKVAGIGAVVDGPDRVEQVDIEKGTGNSLGIAKGFSVWEWFEGTERPAKAKVLDDNGDESVQFKWKGEEASPGTWRIKEFLGCQQAEWQVGPKGSRTFPSISCKSAKPDLLVIDDLGLGFSRHRDCWPPYLSKPSVPVLIKATPPFDTPLWQEVLSRPERKTTVVTTAAGLRDAGAHLSRALSWDKTLREIQDQFGPGGIGWTLRGCERVIVSFGRSGAAVFSRVPRSPEEARKPLSDLRFERLLFDPRHLEDTWGADMPGITFGATSMLTATIAAHLLNDRPQSSHIAVSRGLEAARELHRIGAGHAEGGFDPKTKDARAIVVRSDHLPEKQFRSAYPRELLDDPVLTSREDYPAPEDQSILTDALGCAPAFLTVAAQDIIRFGTNRPLRSVPRLEYGKYFTVDVEEIERLNTVRNLILDYRQNAADSRPLSLAVFGPPGAGKNFAIRELSQALFGTNQAVLEFNLSQFEDLDALHEAFHLVRDESVQGKLPLVFWDEFDSVRAERSLGWLKEFLAPMQDAKFFAKGKAHPFGKCIFMFAGGTRATYEEFTAPIEAKDDADGHEEMRAVKGPDFVSRLRGYVNIKGPNPTGPRDSVHIIRRALLLRSLIERHHKSLLNPVTKELILSPTVADAFLHVGDGHDGKGYKHGSRSMEAIVSLSRVGSSRHFGPSELPGREVLSMHVTPDFMDKVVDRSQYHLTTDDIEILAAKKHDLWQEEKKAQRYVLGPVRDDKAKPPTHPLLKAYDLLDEDAKEGNRSPARLTPMRLGVLGYRIGHGDHPTGAVVPDNEKLPMTKLARSEHRRWMRSRLLEGYAWDPGASHDASLVHKDICKFDQLERNELQLDHQIVAAIRDFIKDKRLALMNVARPSAKRPRTARSRPRRAGRNRNRG